MPRIDRETRASPSAQVSAWELALSVSVLTALAIAQPLYDLLAKNAEFFVVRGAKWGDVGIAIVATSILLPLILALLIAAGYRVSATFGRLLGLAILAVLACFLLWNGFQVSGWESHIWWLAPPLALAAALACARSRGLRTLFVFLSPALLAVPLLFVTNPSIRRALAPQKISEAIDLTENSVAGKAPVVFLLFDELSLASLVTPDLMIDPRRFPHLAELAGQANWYRRATAAADTTVEAVPAILSGLFPESGQLPTFIDHPRNLFTLLAGDYRIHAVEAATRLCPQEINQLGGDSGLLARSVGLIADIGVVWGHLAFPPPLRSHLPPISHTWQSFLGHEKPEAHDEEVDDTEDGFLNMAMREAKSGDRRERFESFLGVIEDGPREESLYFLHAMLPHRPWEYLADGHLYDRGHRVRGLVKEEWVGEQDVVDISLQRYLEQAQMVDGLIGDTMDRLRRVGIFEKALIVVVADHGVAFRSGFSRRLLEPENAAEIAPVPLIIKAPGQTRGRIIDEPVSALGILPTIARLLDAEPDWRVPGEALPGFFDDNGGESVGKARALFYRKDLGPIELREDLFVGVAETASAIARRLVPGPDGQLFLNPGPRSDLVGLQVASLGPIESSDVELDLHNHRNYFDRFAPGEGEGELRYLEGQILLRDWQREPQPLAAVINGSIVASTWAYPHSKNDFQFSMLLPRASLRTGFNELLLLRILPGDEEPGYELLEPVRIVARLEPRVDLERSELVLDGNDLDFGKSIRGKIMRTQTFGEKISVAGWGIDLRRGTPVDRILAFSGGELVASSIPRLPNPWAAEHFESEDYLVSIFQVDFDRDLAPELGRKGIRVFAVSGASARELEASYPVFDPGQEWLERGDGRRFRLVPSSTQGERSKKVAFLDFQGELRHRPVFIGWAGAPQEKVAAAEVVVFRDGQYVTQFAMNRRRDDLVEAGMVPGELADAGFAYRGFQGDVDDLHEGRLQFVAIFPDNLAQSIEIRLGPASTEGLSPPVR